ncbi:MAG: hypothetical protein A2Y62_17985 [Candidatus Fischerbacteria bacterium RBG_13_37_8]|uniref:SUF system FeS cluster assembly SufBD core domain-containing protein n=1 Tax=Candidatus Fischerbacteria bacterium RBG_13_37_8 TaxID=1817863 RepID=A0A1F5VWB6_9BACT|nr:MAG: hypothetical protein A2Y62_17985 [Candidatus Fischerbacteria bacterium RBG_13_37_8]
MKVLKGSNSVKASVRCDALILDTISRSDTYPTLQVADEQYFNFSNYLYHYAPATKGEIIMRGVLKDEAHSVFNGMATIQKYAQNSDSYLSDHVLLLSPDARSDSIPSLEIEANQVKASHSASVGQIDEDMIYYLASRGFEDVMAKKLIVEGFLEPLTSQIALSDLHDKFLKSIEQKWHRRGNNYDWITRR